MPTTEEVHTKIKQATLDHHWWDKNVSASLNHDQEMKIDDGMIYYDNRIYIPQDHALQGEIIVRSHDHITAGHPGIEKTKELVLWEYWVAQDEERHRGLCPHLRGVPMNQVEHPSKSGATSSQRDPFPTMDSHIHWHGHWFTNVQGVRRNLNDRRLLLKGNHTHCMFHRAVIGRVGQDSPRRSLRQTRNAPSSHLWPRHRVCLQVHERPLWLATDQGKHIHRLAPTDRWTDGTSQSGGWKYLWIFVNHLKDDWVEWLSLTTFTHNNCTHSATGKSPFEVNYGYNANVLPGTFPHPRLYHVRLTNAKDTCWSQTSTQESHRPDESPIRQEETPGSRIPHRRQGLARYNQPKSPSTKEETRWQANRSLCHYCKKGSLSVHAKTPYQLAYSSNIQWSTPHPVCTTPHFPIKNNCLHHHQISSTVLNTMKSRKSSTVENARSEERPGNHGTGSQITSSSGKATDQSQTAGYKKTTWDTEELIDKYLAKHVDMVNSRKANFEDWQSYMDPFTGKKVWYNQEQLWDIFRGNDNPTTYTKSPFKPTSIP